MVKIVSQLTYKSTRGEKLVGKSLTQLAEYQPLQKMLANLSIAGLNASARQAMEFYDSHRGPDDVDIPLLPRHITPDIVSVHEAAQHFAERKALIEERVRAAQAAHVEKLRSEASKLAGEGASQAPSVPPAQAGSPKG